jgi:hypothetical protein
MAQMLKGGVIMDVINVEQARIAEEAGALRLRARAPPRPRPPCMHPPRRARARPHRLTHSFSARRVRGDGAGARPG